MTDAQKEALVKIINDPESDEMAAPKYCFENGVPYHEAIELMLSMGITIEEE